MAYRVKKKKKKFASSFFTRVYSSMERNKSARIFAEFFFHFAARIDWPIFSKSNRGFANFFLAPTATPTREARGARQGEGEFEFFRARGWRKSRSPRSRWRKSYMYSLSSFLAQKSARIFYPSAKKNFFLSLHIYTRNLYTYFSSRILLYFASFFFSFFFWLRLYYSAAITRHPLHVRVLAMLHRWKLMYICALCARNVLAEWQSSGTFGGLDFLPSFAIRASFFFLYFVLPSLLLIFTERRAVMAGYEQACNV